jgi:hypothetical protein
MGTWERICAHVEVVCMGYGYARGDKKSQNSRGMPGKEGKLRVDGRPEMAGLVA